MDCPPENENVFSNNREMEKEHADMKRKLDAYKNDKENKSPPIGKNGRPITSRLPSLQKESLMLQCHCFQMKCAQEGTDMGSTCELKCCDDDGERYGWKSNGTDSLKRCSCPVCRCPCKKAYKIEDIPAIMTELAKSESEKREKGEEKGGKSFQQEAQSFINKSLRFGFTQRTVYEKSMEGMKEKGE